MPAFSNKDWTSEREEDKESWLLPMVRVEGAVEFTLLFAIFTLIVFVLPLDFTVAL